MNKRFPPGWITTTVGETCNIRNDLRLPISREERAGMGGPYPYYGPTGQLDAIADFRLDGTFALIGEDGDHFLDVEKKPQTILVSGKFNVNNHAHVIESTEACGAEWFYNYFRHKSLKPYLTRQGAGRYKLNKAALQELQIILPPKREQEAINALFREWSTAVTKMEQLIDLEELRYRAVAKRLIRENEYPRIRFAKLAGRVTRKNALGGALPLTVSGRDGLVSQADYFEKRIAADATEHYTLIRKGEFAYNRSYMRGYPYGAIKRLDKYDEGVVSTLCICFSIKEKTLLDSDYFVYFCEAGGFNQEIQKVAQEGARNHGLLNITMEDFYGIQMPLPPLETQRAVAKALTLLRKNIQILHKQAEALKLQKRALMQKLLTGQWRLKAPETEAA